MIWINMNSNAEIYIHISSLHIHDVNYIYNEFYIYIYMWTNIYIYTNEKQQYKLYILIKQKLMVYSK